MKEIIELSDKTIVIGRNEFLKVKGSIDTNLYYVESGSLRMFVLTDKVAKFRVRLFIKFE